MTYFTKGRLIKFTTFLIICLMFFSGCKNDPKPSVTDKPDEIKTNVNGYGNVVNGGYICTDGNDGLYISSLTDGSIIHLFSDGTKKTIGDLVDSSLLTLHNDILYFYADKGYASENELIEPGIYSYDGTNATKIISGNIISFVINDKIIYSDDSALYSANFDGSEVAELKKGNIKQIAYNANKLYLFELIDQKGCITENNMQGKILQTLSDNASGGLNATKTGLYFLANEGMFFLAYDSEPKQVIYSDGVMGLNAVDDGIYYISSSFGEPALCKLVDKETVTIIPPSEFIDVYEGVIIINSKIYYISGDKLIGTGLDGKNATEINIIQ